MKIAAIATVLFAGFSSHAQASSLRSKNLSKAQIIVHGVLHDFSDKDLAIIGESAIAAYNDVQKNSGFTLKEVKPSLHFGVGTNAEWPCMFCPPDDDSFTFGSEMVLLADIEVGSNSKWPCMFCPPDDDTVALDSMESHKEFADGFCHRLTLSGSANLANAHHCSFSFLEEPGHKVAPLEMMHNKDKTAQGFLSLTGLLHDLSKKDIAIIQATATTLYNKAFSKTGFTLKSVNARGAIQVPNQTENVKQCLNCPDAADKLAWPCMFCPPDDDSFSQHKANVLLLDVEVGSKWPCMFCPPDDDSFQQLSSSELESINKAFSETLCSELRMTGSTNLAAVDDCAMNFFMEHVEQT